MDYTEYLVEHFHLIQTKEEGGLEPESCKQLEELEKLIEEHRFVAHANSILETEQITDKVPIPSCFSVLNCCE